MAKNTIGYANRASRAWPSTSRWCIVLDAWATATTNVRSKNSSSWVETRCGSSGSREDILVNTGTGMPCSLVLGPSVGEPPAGGIRGLHHVGTPQPAREHGAAQRSVPRVDAGPDDRGEIRGGAGEPGLPALRPAPGAPGAAAPGRSP